MARLNRKHLLLFLVILAFIVRAAFVGHIKTHVGDEAMHVQNAKSYVESGIDKNTWFHPPLRHILQYICIKVLGDNPYGWRGLNVLLGTLSILAIYMLAKEVSGNERVAALASIFMLFDPLHVMFSRTTFEEIQGGLFIMAAIYFTLKHLKGNALAALAAGALLGVSMATKWYYLPAWAILTCFVAYQRYAQGTLRAGGVLHIFSVYLILPITIYLSTFYFWFARGYGIVDFLSMQTGSYRMLEETTIETFASQYISILSVPVWQWFLKPVITGFQIWDYGTWSLSVVFMNNPFIWMLTMPSVAYIALKSIKKPDASLVLTVLLFAVSYAQFGFISRPVFFYSALSLLPFVFLIIAFALVSLIETYTQNKWHYKLLVFLVVTSYVYLLPLALNMPYPTSLYKPVFAFSTMIKPF